MLQVVYFRHTNVFRHKTRISIQFHRKPTPVRYQFATALFTAFSHAKLHSTITLLLLALFDDENSERYYLYLISILIFYHLIKQIRFHFPKNFIIL